VTKFDKEILIAAAAREVFDYVSRPEHFSEFLPISSLVFLTNMRRGVGTRVRYSRILEGKEVPAECGLSKQVLDQMVEFTATKGLMRVWRFTIQELDDGTQLHWEGEYDVPSGMMNRFSGQKNRLEASISQELDQSLDKIKQALEAK
jgi:ribosome-associated toxin RatA of RatAB toxin-antitoxin module